MKNEFSVDLQSQGISDLSVFFGGRRHFYCMMATAM